MHPKSLLSRLPYGKMITLLLTVTILLAGITGPLSAQATDARRDQPSQPAPPRATSAPAETALPMPDPHPDLAEALAFAPIAAPYFEYTNWALLKKWSGVAGLDSRSAIDERIAFMVSLGREEHALGAGFARSYFLEHAETWGWDSTDLLWEAAFVTGSGGSYVHVLRLRDDLDVETIIARLEARDFTRENQDTGQSQDKRAIAVYSHPMDLSAEWIRSTDFAILNTAVVADANILLLSSTPESLQIALEAWRTGETLLLRPDVVATAAGLGEAGAAFLDARGCPLLDVARFMTSNEDLDTIRATLEEMMNIGAGGLYTVLGLAYRRAVNGDGDSVGVGVFVHHYPLAEQAHADLEPRRTIAEEASSGVRNDLPYASLFRVRDANVKEIGTGANLNLVLESIDRTPQLFFDMVLQRDIYFSMCSG